MKYWEKNKTLCGIVDCQGYVKEGKYVPKEFAIAYSESRDSEIRRKLGKYIDKVILHHNSLCFGINTQLDEKDMNAIDLCVNGYIELTGLNYHPNSDRYIKLEELPDLLCRLYNACKKRKNDVFGVNNNQFEHVLTDLGIPWTNVATPSFDELDDYFMGNWKCSLHSLEYARCALRKVYYIKQWLEERTTNQFNK